MDTAENTNNSSYNTVWLNAKENREQLIPKEYIANIKIWAKRNPDVEFVVYYGNKDPDKYDNVEDAIKIKKEYFLKHPNIKVVDVAKVFYQNEKFFTNNQFEWRKACMFFDLEVRFGQAAYAANYVKWMALNLKNKKIVADIGITPSQTKIDFDILNEKCNNKLMLEPGLGVGTFMYGNENLDTIESIGVMNYFYGMGYYLQYDMSNLLGKKIENILIDISNIHPEKFKDETEESYIDRCDFFGAKIKQKYFLQQLYKKDIKISFRDKIPDNTNYRQKYEMYINEFNRMDNLIDQIKKVQIENEEILKEIESIEDQRDNLTKLEGFGDVVKRYIELRPKMLSSRESKFYGDDNFVKSFFSTPFCRDKIMKELQSGNVHMSSWTFGKQKENEKNSKSSTNEFQLKMAGSIFNNIEKGIINRAFNKIKLLSLPNKDNKSIKK